MPYMMGLLEGFQQRRDKEYERNYQQDQDRRRQEGEFYKLLLSSDNPDTRALAATSLLDSAQPGKRSKGFSGYLGEIQSSPTYAKVRSWINEMVPVEGEQGQPTMGGPAPPQPGSAAMPTNVPVQPGSAPINLGGAVPGGPDPSAFDANASWNPGMGGGGSVPSQADPSNPVGGPTTPGGLAPPPIPGYSPLFPKIVESKFKRRGTGIATAEEIAEKQAEASVRGRFGATGDMLRGVGATDEEVQEAFLGMAGRPRSARQFERATGMGVKLPSGKVVPVSFDNTSGQYFLPDGKTPLPPDAELVSMTRSAGSSSQGSLTSTVRDTPDVRAQYGIEADVPNTGWLKIKQLADGTTQALPTVYTPPPAYSGSMETFDASGVPVRVPILRGGGTGASLGDTGAMRDSQEATTAKALLTAVDRQIAAQARSGIGRLRGVAPEVRDRIVQDAAQKAGVGYQTYEQLTQAAGQAKVPARQAIQGSKRDAVEEDLRKRGIIGGGGSLAPPPLP